MKYQKWLTKLQKMTDEILKWLSHYSKMAVLLWCMTKSQKMADKIKNDRVIVVKD
jgi:uncharacterized membrane protein